MRIKELQIFKIIYVRLLNRIISVTSYNNDVKQLLLKSCTIFLVRANYSLKRSQNYQSFACGMLPEA
jgi:hypothetical protein